MSFIVFLIFIFIEYRDFQMVRLKSLRGLIVQDVVTLIRPKRLQPHRMALLSVYLDVKLRYNIATE